MNYKTKLTKFITVSVFRRNNLYMKTFCNKLLY